jgi:hypothetical protein
MLNPYRKGNRQGPFINKRDRETGETTRVPNPGRCRTEQALLKHEIRVRLEQGDAEGEIIRNRKRQALAKSERRKTRKERCKMAPWKFGQLDGAKIESQKRHEDKLAAEAAAKAAARVERAAKKRRLNEAIE